MVFENSWVSQTNARQKQKFPVQYFKQIFENDSLNFSSALEYRANIYRKLMFY